MQGRRAVNLRPLWNLRILLEVRGQVDCTLACICKAASEDLLVLLVQVGTVLGEVHDRTVGLLLLVDVLVARARRSRR